jgi:sugar lactone lactonase YvrE
VVDGEGNIYIGDYANQAVRKVSATSGTITTIAGTIGTSGTSGNGGPATSALLDSPLMGSVDAKGNVYVLDDCSDVRKIDATTGVITLIAGTAGTDGLSGDGGQASAALLTCPGAAAFDTSGNLYVADSGTSEIRKISATTGIISDVAGQNNVFGSSGTGGQATSASFDELFDISY